MKRAYNFAPGPAVLPIEVLEETSKAVLDFNNLGISIMEISHRSKDFDALIKETQQLTLELMGLSSDDYAVLFLGGGASLQFLMVPLNFLREQADYVSTGYWSKKAIKEAQWVGKTNVVASSEEANFTYIPKDIKFTPNADYVHITTNNTIFGTQWKEIPDTGDIPLVADMSSDFLGITRDFKRFSLIYAGAQKNVGPAGVTVVVIKRKWLEEKGNPNVATMLNYSTHVKENSLFNTPPCVNIFVVNRTLKWIKKQGGVEAVYQTNLKKANLLYDFFDANSDFWITPVKNKEDRSLMNIVVNLPTPELENKFVEEAKSKHNMTNLKGHRSVGGIRVSSYNACPIEWIEDLVKFMEEFTKENR
ncbi:MAG: 3-phosphoserine/phosphohydroxythreonine transaminase [Ignavibacteria bacterium]|nr:3-phosphoserine/phosphohydroxythreonine transaminase [Ignavibacteria bacterium]